MFDIRKIVIAALLALAATAAAAEPRPVPNPEKYAEDFVSTLFKSGSQAAADIITATVGQPSQRESINNALRLFEGKTLNFGKKVIDKEFNGALRQIIYYTYIDNLGFTYFRFNFKMSRTGWLLANFTFKSETDELFPKDFVER